MGTDSPAEPRSILVVDDDPSIRRMIVSTLRRDGYVMSEARNGREALEVMHSQHEDLVLLDLMMPEVSGWEVLRVRSEDRELLKIPVIVITAHHGVDVPDPAENGVCALLHKPFELSALHHLVKTCLNEHQHNGDDRDG